MQFNGIILMLNNSSAFLCYFFYFSTLYKTTVNCSVNLITMQAFVELEQLTKHGEEMEWQEMARWIKFEENVEDSNRWGKPHVASLTFHSLLELRKGLEKGTQRNEKDTVELPLMDTSCRQTPPVGGHIL